MGVNESSSTQAPPAYNRLPSRPRTYIPDENSGGMSSHPSPKLWASCSLILTQAAEEVYNELQDELSSFVERGLLIREQVMDEKCALYIAVFPNGASAGRKTTPGPVRFGEKKYYELQHFLTEVVTGGGEIYDRLVAVKKKAEMFKAAFPNGI